MSFLLPKRFDVCSGLETQSGFCLGRPAEQALISRPVAGAGMCEFMLPLQAQSKLEDELTSLDSALPAVILQRRWVDAIYPALPRASLCSQCGPWDRP